MKQVVRIAAVALCAAILLAGCAAALSRVVYGRSLRASLYEIALRWRFANHRTAEEEIARLEARRERGESTYAIPGDCRPKAEVIEDERHGMQVFTLPGGETTVLYLHGGAFINRFSAEHWRFMDRLARKTGCTIVAPDYPLAPYADYARAYEALSGLYRDLLAQNSGRLLLMGDSAGGGLALGLAEYLLGQGDPLPERLILFSPWVDVSMENPEIPEYVPVDPMLHLELVKVHGRYWAGGADTRYWMVSPLYGALSGLPPVAVYCGTRELLYPDLLRLHAALTAAGVDATRSVGRGMNHDYPLMPLPEADAVFREVAELVRG